MKLSPRLVEIESRWGAACLSFGVPRSRGFYVIPPEGGTPNRSQRNSRTIHGGDSEQDDRRQAQDRRDNRDEICVDFEPAEKPLNDLILQNPGDDQSGGEKSDKADQSKDTYIMPADVKDRPLEEGYVHVLV